jgi:hypothetical protein
MTPGHSTILPETPVIEIHLVTQNVNCKDPEGLHSFKFENSLQHRGPEVLLLLLAGINEKFLLDRNADISFLSFFTYLSFLSYKVQLTYHNLYLV